MGYFIKFYAVDNHGGEMLAATGEDQGDAHYLYRSTDEVVAAGYPPVNCHNRKELLAWLNNLTLLSQATAGFHVEDAHDEERLADIRAKACPHHFPPFIAHRMEKGVAPSGVRTSRWWLLDEEGHEHLAVVGEERDTRDGHYLYRTEEPFTSTHPLSCGSQSKVVKWLEKMIVLHAPGGKAQPATSGDGDGSDSELVSKSGKRGWSRPSAFKRSGSSSLKSGPPTASARPGSKRQRYGDSSAAAPLSMRPESRSALELLGQWAVAEGAAREEAGRAALAWLRDGVDEGEAAAVHAYRAKAGEALGPLPEGEDPDQWLLDCMEAVAELGSMYMPAKLLADAQLLPLMHRLAQHQDPVMAELATRVVKRWQRTAAHYVSVLTNPIYIKVPSRELVTLMRSQSLSSPAKPTNGLQQRLAAAAADGDGEQAASAAAASAVAAREDAPAAGAEAEEAAGPPAPAASEEAATHSAAEGAAVEEGAREKDAAADGGGAAAAANGALDSAAGGAAAPSGSAGGGGGAEVAAATAGCSQTQSPVSSPFRPPVQWSPRSARSPLRASPRTLPWQLPGGDE